MNSIRFKILSSVLAVLIISMSGIGYFSMHYSRKAQIKQIERNTIQLSEGYAVDLSSKINFYKRLMHTVALSIFNAINIENILIDQKRAYPELEQFFYTSLSGKIIEYHPRKPEFLSINFHEKDYWKKVYENWKKLSKDWKTLTSIHGEAAQTYIVKESIVVSTVTNTFGPWSIVISVPVPIYYGGLFVPPDIQGMIHVVIQITALFKHINNIKIGTTGAMVVINQKGKILFHPDKSFILNKNLSEINNRPDLIHIENAMRDQSTGIGIYQYNEKNYFLAFAPLTEIPWSLGVFGAVDEFTQGVKEIRHVNLFIVLISVLISTIMLVFLIGTIVKPIRHLTGILKDIRKGNLKTQARVSSGDEIGQMAMTLNTMTRQLNDSFNEREILVHELKQKNVKLEHLDKLKDAFLANTSHELRTPLNGIIGLAESLIETSKEDISSFVHSNLQMIVVSGKRLASLINDILDYSRLKEKELTLKKSPTSIYVAADIVCTLCTPMASQKKIALINDISKDLPAAQADENRLQQILYNLIGNSIKFTESGHVRISAKIIQNSSNIKMIEIEVSDTGIGIPLDRQDSIFESFEQADITIERNYGGTGIGLTITKKLIELHGGSIRVESEPEKGASFIFTLPKSNSMAVVHQKRQDVSFTRSFVSDFSSIKKEIFPLPEIESHTSSEHKGVILIADDEPVNQQVLFNFLSSDYHIINAYDGLEVIDILNKKPPPDMVLLDVMMPVMSGYEATQKIRRQWKKDELPIILLTAKNQVTDLLAGFDAGANDYITKPVSKEELLARIKTHLSIISLKNDSVQMVIDKKAAESANEAKSTFIANMSHELRTPLNAIIGYAQMLKRDARFNNVPGLKTIEQSGNHLLSLINDILDIAKIESGNMEIYPNIFHFYSFLDEICNIIRVKAEEKDVYFKFQADKENLPEYVNTDEKRLRQILLNLLSNAVKFTHKGGVRFRVKPEESKVICFEIHDTGMGISNKEIENIFKPFQQIDPQFNQSQGTGLGLSITKTLVKLMGGELKIESKPGDGSTFWFEISIERAPRRVIENKKNNQQIIELKNSQQYKILIIDDNSNNRQLFKDLLLPMDFVIEEATNGQEGLNKLSVFEPDLIITDLMMPVMDGFELIENIRKENAFKKIPVIATSSSVYDQFQIKSLKSGANVFLPRPFNMNQLLKHLGKLLNIEVHYQANESMEDEILLPPQEILEQLLDLIQSGLIFDAEVLLDEFKSNKELQAFYEKMKVLLDALQVDEIQSFLSAAKT